MNDALSTLLDDVRPRGALFDRSVMDGPWSIRFVAHPPLTMVTLLGGEGWITPDGGAPIPFRTGDVAVVVGQEPFTVSDAPGAPPTVLVHGAGRCTTTDGHPIAEPAIVDGAGPRGSAVLLTGTYDVRGSVCDRILRGLPAAFVIRADTLPFPTLDVITAELTWARPGRQAVLDRLLDLLLVTALREWLDRPGSGAPAWYHAQDDPVVGSALHVMHDDPAHPWTVAELARRAAVSRSAFARRFTELVGEPPMSYLACWRLCLAADLLVDSQSTVESIARTVGYANAYALSVAFKRVHGIRPGEHRRRSQVPHTRSTAMIARA